jgi:hypothetical protein
MRFYFPTLYFLLATAAAAMAVDPDTNSDSRQLRSRSADTDLSPEVSADIFAEDKKL